MIAYLTGRIIRVSTNYIVLDVNGVGYKVFVAPGFREDDNVTFYTHHYVREQEQSLYGFATWQELNLFELLITVNGVGPKAAMAIMRSAKSDKIISAISSGDSALFKTVSGIGQKVAAKIIVELKTKVGGLGDIDLTSLEGGSDVVDALEALGYRKGEIGEVIRQMPTEFKNTQEKISWALKQMGKNNH